LDLRTSRPLLVASVALTTALAPSASCDSPDAARSSGGDDAATGGAGDDAGPAMALLDNPTGPLPRDLEDAGLFPAFPDLSTVTSRAFRFEPRYSLYSNGLDKVRYLVLPSGEQIDTSVRDRWNFPVGTLLFKTFSFKDPAAGGKERPVETRLIRRLADSGDLTDVQWDFQVYQWNESGTAATLVDIRRMIPREINADGETFTHNIPSIKQCWNCHLANKTMVIGFDELRLNVRVGVAAETQLEQVIAKKWLTSPPAAPFLGITGGRDPLETSVMEYLHANCVHCHNGEQMAQQPGARYPQLDLNWDQLIKSTVGVQTMSVGTASGIRVVPGDPAKSMLLLAMKAIADPTANTEVKPMPTVGVDRMDQKAVDTIERWIETLAP
jgi:hypothetical protein